MVKTFLKFFNRKIQNKLYKGISKSERKRRKSNTKMRFDTNYNEISLVVDEESKSPYIRDNSNGGSNEVTNQKFTYYYYHKILSSDQYSLGKKVVKFLSDFNEEFDDVEESAGSIPKPLIEVYKITNDVVKDLYSNYNISGNNKNLMQFCRASVEKYIFSKIYSRMFSMYKYKFDETNRLYNERSLKTRSVDPIEMLKSLGVSKKYIIWDGFKFSNSDNKYEFSKPRLSISESVDSSHISESDDGEYTTPRQPQKNNEDEMLPYHESIKALERISSFTSPRDKID